MKTKRLLKPFFIRDALTVAKELLGKYFKIKKSQIVATKRIGIDYAGAWAGKPWRFYIKDNPFISRK